MSSTEIFLRMLLILAGIAAIKAFPKFVWRLLNSPFHGRKEWKERPQEDHFTKFLRPKKWPLSLCERNFYEQLVAEATKAGLMVFPKMRMLDLFFVTNEKSWNGKRAMERLWKKHVDFVLYDPKQGMVGCIELDDSSHSGNSLADVTKNQAFQTIGMPFYRVRAKGNMGRYSFDWLKIVNSPIGIIDN